MRPPAWSSACRMRLLNGAQSIRFCPWRQLPGRSSPMRDEAASWQGAGQVAMSVETKADVVATLEKAKGELQAMAHMVESKIELVARAFEGLAGHTDTIVSLAAAIVGCVENESVSSVLPKVQTLGAAARVFIGDRLQATTGILEMVTTEVKLLRQLSRVAGDQEAIALEIKALSVLTNIEVARLGTVGAGFQYLAHELANFSKSVIEDTKELA